MVSAELINLRRIGRMHPVRMRRDRSLSHDARCMPQGRPAFGCLDVSLRSAISIVELLIYIHGQNNSKFEPRPILRDIQKMSNSFGFVSCLPTTNESFCALFFFRQLHSSSRLSG